MAKVGQRDRVRQLFAKVPLRRSRDFAGKVDRETLRRLVAAGELERVARGLYRLPSAPVTVNHSLALVAGRLPHAVIGLLSALQFHGLTTELPADVWILVPQRARHPAADYPPLRVVRASGPSLAHGVEEHIIEGVTVRITSPAKTVADCFHYRRHVGLDVALEALRDYLRQHRGKVAELLAAARVVRVAAVLRPYLEALS